MMIEELIAWTEQAARLDASRDPGYAHLTEKQQHRLQELKRQVSNDVNCRDQK